MRNRFITLLGIIALSPLLLVAQDYDDIYYDGSSQKKITSNKAIEYTNLSKSNTPAYYDNTSSIVSERDVDEYNRRGDYASSSTTDPTAANDKDFVYTEKIEKYYNPSIIENQNDSILELMYYSLATPTTVNIIVGSQSSYSSPWSWGGSSYYDPWNWRYSSSCYNPWYSPYYNSWNWGYNHHHHYYPSYYPPYYPSYYPSYRYSNNGRRPYGYNSGNGYASNSRRPGYDNGTVRRPGQSSGRPTNDRQYNRRPGYTQDRNYEGSRGNRPTINNGNTGRRPNGGATNVRPTTIPSNNRENSNYRENSNARENSNYRDNSNNYQENNRRESYSTTPSNNRGSSGSGYSGGGRSNSGGGGGRSNGGGRR